MKRIKDRKTVFYYVFMILFLLSSVWGLKTEVLAAFPYDMEQKEVIADAIVDGPVTVYKDYARKKKKDSTTATTAAITLIAAGGFLQKKNSRPGCRPTT